MSPVPRPPGPRELLPFVGGATVSGLAVFWLGLPAPWPLWALASASAVSAAVVGLPVFVWLIEHGRTGGRTLTVAGAAAGALPPAVALLSGMVGFAARGGLDYLQWALGYGAPIPAYGTLPWAGFARIEALAMLTGALAGVIGWRFNRVQQG